MQAKQLLIALLWAVPLLATAQTVFEAKFDPITGVLPNPINLLFTDSSDGTLNIPIADPSDPSSVLFNTLNALDGFSTVAPLTAEFSDAVDPATIVAGGSVRVFEVALVNPFLDSGSSEAFTVTKVVAELRAGEDFIAGLLPEDSTQQTVLITPLRPLKAKTGYMVVLTDAIRAVDGRFPFPDLAYIFSRYQEGPLLDGNGNSRFSALSDTQAQALEPIRRIVVSQEDAAATAGVSRGSIVLSWSFMTQSVDDALQTVASNIIARPMDLMTTGINTAALGVGLPGIADIYVGSLQVPYYLEAPNLVASVILTTRWKGTNDSEITRYNPQPLAPQNLTIPVMATLPNAASGHSKPATGWPVVIFQHGFTGQRTNVLAIADALAVAGFATVAIDLPLHGVTDTTDPFYAGMAERTFNVDLVDNALGTPGPDGNIDDSGIHYINLSSLLTGRDNLRQGVADLLQLAVSIPGVDTDADGVTDFDANSLYFSGFSLGAVVGTVFTTVENNLRAVALQMTGGGLPKLLDGSAHFGPIIRAGLVARGLIAGTPEYAAYMRVAQTAIDSGDAINYALAAADKNPIYMMEVVGSAGSLPDQTIPNSVVDAPLSGTEPLIRIMALSGVSQSVMDPAGLRGVVRFTAGAHSSLLLSTVSPAATLEMQSQTAAFLASNGTMIVVNNSTVVQAAP